MFGTTLSLRKLKVTVKIYKTYKLKEKSEKVIEKLLM